MVIVVEIWSSSSSRMQNVYLMVSMFHRQVYYRVESAVDFCSLVANQES